MRRMSLAFERPFTEWSGYTNVRAAERLLTPTRSTSNRPPNLNDPKHRQRNTNHPINREP